MPRKTANQAKLKEAIQIIEAPVFADVPGVIHGFSTRVGGVSHEYGENQLNLGFTAADKRVSVAQNRGAFLEKLGGADLPLLTLRQVHSSTIHVVAGPHPSAHRRPLTGDGVISSAHGLLLGIQTADCMPILIADPKRRVVAAVHAGWRGTVKRIAEKAVGSMRALFGSKPQDLRAAIGPGIHQCCYAVGDDVIEAFVSQFSYAKRLFHEVYDKDAVKKKYPLLFLTARAPGHSNIGPEIHLDLVEANRRQLLEAGVTKKHIWAAEECTSCRTDLLFSHRAEHGYTGRMMAVIGLG